MESRELGDYIKQYQEKTGCKFTFMPGFTTWYLPDRGFCQFKIIPETKTMFIYDTCNDARFWRDALECVCMQHGIDFIMTLCIRSILPYIRYFGWTIKQEFTKDGFKRYVCSDKQGREIVITAKHVDGRGKISYIVTQALRKQYKEWVSENG
jgi:hypothetical protein